MPAYKRKPQRMASGSRKKYKASPSYRKSSPNPGFAKRIGGRITLGISGPETKIDDEFNSTSLTAAGVTSASVGLLDTIAQGTNSVQRVGNKVTVRSLSLTANIVCLTTAGVGTTLNPQFTWAIVLDKQPNATNAVFSDVFKALGGGFSNLLFRNNDNLERFQILREGKFEASDWQIVQGNTGVPQAFGHIECYLPTQIEARYADATGAPQTNNILLLFSANATGSQSYQFDPFTRIRYSDA